MLPPESSPVHQLVFPWWSGTERPSAKDVSRARETLAQGALDELRIQGPSSGYCPFADARILWAAQFLKRIEGTLRFRIDPDLTARAAFVFNPSPNRCGKDLAVGPN